MSFAARQQSCIIARSRKSREALVAGSTHSFTTEDIEYLRTDDRSLLLRLFKPSGAGPFPVVVELHGGAWRHGDRMVERERHAALAKGGLIVAALDFSQGADGAYPRSVAEINYAVRWIKAHAETLNARPDLIGISGQSSGGHLAMLVAMKPADPRYAALALPKGSPAVDASLRCVAMSWPVINPLSRYRHALRARDGANPPTWPVDIIEGHQVYWQDEANMADGSPLLALERRDAVQTPPALWIQAYNDILHDYRDADSGFPANEPQRFAVRYREAGGEIDIVYFDAPLRFTSVKPDSPAALDAFERLVDFFRRHMPVKA
jgi:acetyl esterase